MKNKTVLILALILSGSLIAISFLFAAPKNPPAANEYIKLKKQVVRLENQMRIYKEGWDGCLQEYEILMQSCDDACDGKI